MRKSKKRMNGRAALLVGVFSLLAFLFLSRVRPVFLEYAENYCQDTAMQQINAAMQQAVFDHPEQYRSLVVLDRDAENRITAVRTDTVLVGAIKAALIDELIHQLNQLERGKVKIPLGTMIAPDFLSGIGPRLPFGLVGMGQVDANFISSFEQAGVNQTRHCITIEIHADVRLLTPFGGKELPIATSYPITDTVIVGTVPNQYLYLDGKSEESLTKVKE